MGFERRLSWHHKIFCNQDLTYNWDGGEFDSKLKGRRLTSIITDG